MDEINEDSIDIDNTNLLQNETKNEEGMEIHHSHKKHHKLGIKEYLFEFLMLFLAVSAGFLVENLREDYLERHREHQYIESLVRDLKTDTISLNETILEAETQIKGIDTLRRILLKDNIQNAGLIYYYSFKYWNSLNLFTINDRTITQLKNSGNLRLINFQDVSDSIISYYIDVEDIDVNSEFNLKHFEKLLESMKLIFNYKILDELDSLETLRNDKEIKLFCSEPSVLNSYYTDVLILNSLTYNYNFKLKALKIKGAVLLKFLKEKYHLEE